MEPLEEHVFLKPKRGEQFEKDSFCGIITSLFIRWTQDVLTVPIHVTPHSIRHMTSSYTEDMNLTKEQSNSVAFCQHHSSEVHQRVYTHAENLKKIAPAQKVWDTVIQQCLPGGVSESRNGEVTENSLEEPLQITNGSPPDGVDPIAWFLLAPEQQSAYLRILKSMKD